jgi:hypothetical protein
MADYGSSFPNVPIQLVAWGTMRGNIRQGLQITCCWDKALNLGPSLQSCLMMSGVYKGRAGSTTSVLQEVSKPVRSVGNVREM